MLYRELRANNWRQGSASEGDVRRRAAAVDRGYGGYGGDVGYATGAICNRRGETENERSAVSLQALTRGGQSLRRGLDAAAMRAVIIPLARESWPPSDWTRSQLRGASLVDLCNPPSPPAHHLQLGPSVIPSA